MGNSLFAGGDIDDVPAFIRLRCNHIIDSTFCFFVLVATSHLTTSAESFLPAPLLG